MSRLHNALHTLHTLNIPPPDALLFPYLPSWPIPLSTLPKPLAHFLGHRPPDQKPTEGTLSISFWSLIGSFCGIAAVAALYEAPFIKGNGGTVIIASFGAAAILTFSTLQSPLSQPRNNLLGQLLGAVIGVAIAQIFRLLPSAHFLALRWLAGALAVALTAAAMVLTDTVHPPAGATALIAVVEPSVEGLRWNYVWVVMASAGIMVAVGCLVNNIGRRWPVYWWRKDEGGKEEENKKKPADEESGKVVGEHGAKIMVYSGFDVVIADGGIWMPKELRLSDEEERILRALGQRLSSVRRSEVADAASETATCRSTSHSSAGKESYETINTHGRAV